MATGAEVLKTFSVSRLLFDNVDHVKCFWVMHGLTTAQLTLTFGADDLDGSVVEYKITHDADGFGTPNQLTREDLLELIREAGFQPVERDTRYNVLREYAGPAGHRGAGRGVTMQGQQPAARRRTGPNSRPRRTARRPARPCRADLGARLRRGADPGHPGGRRGTCRRCPAGSSGSARPAGHVGVQRGVPVAAQALGMGGPAVTAGPSTEAP